MDPREFPTKGNLMLAKNSLAPVSYTHLDVYKRQVQTLEKEYEMAHAVYAEGILRHIIEV